MSMACVVDGKLYEARPAEADCEDCAGDGEGPLCGQLGKCETDHDSVIWVLSLLTLFESSSAPYNLEMLSVGMGIPKAFHHAFCLGFEDGHCDGQADPDVKYLLSGEQQAYNDGVKVALIVTRKEV